MDLTDKEGAKRPEKFRYSSLGKEIHSGNSQDLVWPATPSYDNPIVKIHHDYGYGHLYFDFELKNGEKTSMKKPNVKTGPDIIMNPDEVRFAQIHWYPANAGLYCVVLQDKNRNDLLKIGYFKDATVKVQEIELEEGERLVGITSDTKKHYHCDLQFIIASR